MSASIYDFPSAFRAVHMEHPGEIAAEVAFLKKVWARHLKRPVRRVLDVACGTSPHGQILARGGVEVVAIDRAPRMLAAGRAEARGIGRLRFYRRRIENFRIPLGNCDAAFFMSETFPVITANAALLTHLKSVARALRPGGLYCIDVDRQDGVFTSSRGRELLRRRRVRLGTTGIDVREYRRPMAWYAGAWTYEIECDIGFPERTVSTRDAIPVRYTLPSLLEFAAAASEVFEPVACYIDLSLRRVLAKCERRWLGVLRRR